jgi:hypothetical protein
MVSSIRLVAIWMIAQTLSRCAILDPRGLISKRHIWTGHIKSRIQQAVRLNGIPLAPAKRVPTKKYSSNPMVRSCHCIVKSLSSPKLDTVSLQYSDG